MLEMIKLSHTNTINKFAIPSGKYIIQIEPSSDVEIMTYIGQGLFKRHPFGFDLGYLDYESHYFNIDRDDNTKKYYIVPLELILETQSVKDLLNDKEIYSKDDVESYSIFINAIKNEFNKLEKIPAELKGRESYVVLDGMGLEQLLDYQFEFSKLGLSKLELSKKDKELYIYQTQKKLSPFLQLSY